MKKVEKSKKLENLKNHELPNSAPIFGGMMIWKYYPIKTPGGGPDPDNIDYLGGSNQLDKNWL